MNNKKIISILLFLILAFTPTVTLARGAHPVFVPPTARSYNTVINDKNDNVIYSKSDSELKKPDELDKGKNVPEIKKSDELNKNEPEINYEEQDHYHNMFVIYIITLIGLILFIFYLVSLHEKAVNKQKRKGNWHYY